MDTLKIVENRWNINSRPFFVFTNSGCASSLPQGAWIPAWYLPLERRVREKYRILFSVANRYPRFIVSRGSAGHGIGFILLLALARVPHSSGAALHKFPCRCDAISHRRRDRNRIYIYIREYRSKISQGLIFLFVRIVSFLFWKIVLKRSFMERTFG